MFDIAFVNPTAVCHVLLDIVRYFRESVDTVVSQRCCKFVAYLRGFSGGHFKSFFFFLIRYKQSNPDIT